MRKLTRNEIIYILEDAAIERRTADLSNLDVQGMDLSGIYFGSANLAGARFVNTYLILTNFLAANLTEATFIGCRGSHVSFNSAKVDRTYFYACEFAFSDMSEMSGYDLSMLNCNLIASNWYDTHITDGDFMGSSLSEASLNNAVFRDTSFQSVTFSKGTSFNAASFVNCSHLRTSISSTP